MPKKARSVLSLNARWVILSVAATLATAPLAARSPANAADFSPGDHGFLDTGGSFTQIDVPGAIFTGASGINGAGQIVGFFYGNDTVSHGFLDTGGSFTQIDVPGATTTSPFGINGAGQIVGAFSTITGGHGFLDTGGSFTQIDVPGATFTQANGINGAGQIVGSFTNSTGTHGFLNTGGSFMQIDVPGATTTLPFGINGAGQIVGEFNQRGLVHGFIDTGGSFTQIDVPVPGASETQASGINDTGQIVGTFLNHTGFHGFLDTGGSFTQIDVPGGFATFANGINDAGQIVGQTSIGSAIGDPHFTTYDGVHYDYQGIGNFLLTRSMVPGDQFDVQIRSTGFSNAGTPVSMMTEAVATLCNHNVTFDIDRASAGGSFVWIDGSPSSLSVASPVLTLGTCRIDELSPEHYQVVWNTGEMLDVTDNGTYLDLSSQLSWIDALGSMEGLLSSNLDPDAWRVTDAASLLNDVPEPGTFTLLGIGLVGLGIIRRRAILPDFQVRKGRLSVRKRLTGKAAWR
jgi:hypothetical protein